MHGEPSEKRIEKGDFITIDIGCVLDGYCSDMTRTITVEISTHMNFEGKFIGLHLLGYDIDVGNTKLNGIFSYLRRCRQKTNERVFELVESDFGIGREEILTMAPEIPVRMPRSET